MSLEAVVRQVQANQQQMGAAIGALAAKVNLLLSRPRTITEEIDAIPGRRIESTFSGIMTFGTAQQGTRGNPILIQISQDGPFIQTHYPMVLWRPTAPTSATNYQRWRPVSSFPLPDQVYDTDGIDISYEIQDGGAQRNFQNMPRGPMISRPDNLIPCPVPTQWAPNSAIQFTPIFNRVTFNGDVAPTEGTLQVDFIGYRIVNL